VNAARFLPALLASLTLIVLLGNALPAAQRKHRLQHEQRLLLQERRVQAERRERLLAERAALIEDPFYLERTYSETWATKPHGVLELDEVAGTANE
jgi:glycyl-tRNA synthetase beta subunit